MSPTLLEAKRLYDLGFAILWIKPKSKAPVKAKWTTGPRDSWQDLKSTYRAGFNVGVRLGTPSLISGKYLAVIDVDVKSTDKRHQAEAEKAVAELFPSLPPDAIRVMSGRGNGSSHIYVLTKEAAQPSRRKVSSERVKVMMPSAPVNQSQREQLSEEDLNEGWRMRPAWEVAVMGEGQQVVLPPSTHPDTGRAYIWKVGVKEVSEFTELNLGHKKKELTREATEDWKPEEVDLTFSSLPNEIMDLLLYADCDDRSAALMKVSRHLISEGLTDRQILSVFTDRSSYALAETGFDHAKTDSRARAANWVFNFTLKKARTTWDANSQFDSEVETVTLEESEAKKQANEILTPPDWRMLIERYGDKGINAGRPRSTLKNMVLILTNEVASDIFVKDEFAQRESYGRSTPWGGEKGVALDDSDALKIKMWLANRYRFEPSKDLVFEAMSFLSSENSFDPVRTWLEQLPDWDGVNRLDGWLAKNFEAQGDREYLAQVFRKWVVAMVLRVYEPGAKFDWMPIFEGAQGVGKSSFGRLLVGEAYFRDWLPDLSDKDSALGLSGSWCVEFGELSNIRKQDVESAKAFITRTIDKLRPPYGRKTLEIPRRCVFFGTTNSDTYLRDDSGNRRFKPVKVGRLNFEVLREERNQLFAEALFIYKNGFETERTLEIEGVRAQKFEAEIHSDKMVEDDAFHMREEILKYIQESGVKDEIRTLDFNRFRIVDLFETGAPLQQLKRDTRAQHFATKAVKSLGGRNWKSNGIMHWSLKALREGVGDSNFARPSPEKTQ